MDSFLVPRLAAPCRAVPRRAVPRRALLCCAARRCTRIYPVAPLAAGLRRRAVVRAPPLLAAPRASAAIFVFLTRGIPVTVRNVYLQLLSFSE